MDFLRSVKGFTVRFGSFFCFFTAAFFHFFFRFLKFLYKLVCPNFYVDFVVPSLIFFLFCGKLRNLFSLFREIG